MQDTYTGNMVPLEGLSQEHKDAALPRDRQGCCFEIGETVEIKGGNFSVQSIGKTMIVFRSLPGTDIK